MKYSNATNKNFPQTATSMFHLITSYCWWTGMSKTSQCIIAL